MNKELTTYCIGDHADERRCIPTTLLGRRSVQGGDLMHVFPPVAKHFLYAGTHFAPELLGTLVICDMSSSATNDETAVESTHIMLFLSVDDALHPVSYSL